MPKGKPDDAYLIRQAENFSNYKHNNPHQPPCSRTASVWMELRRAVEFIIKLKLKRRK